MGHCLQTKGISNLPLMKVDITSIRTVFPVSSYMISYWCHDIFRHWIKPKRCNTVWKIICCNWFRSVCGRGRGEGQKWRYLDITIAPHSLKLKTTRDWRRNRWPPMLRPSAVGTAYPLLSTLRPLFILQAWLRVCSVECETRRLPGLCLN